MKGTHVRHAVERVADASDSWATEPTIEPGNVRLGLVVIGRNEGERLGRCLRSASGCADAVVYVDSGSVDGSVATARRFGADVVVLDPRQPFTAARARNAGFRALREAHPGIVAVQFVDGDCEIAPRWLDRAFAFLRTHPDVAAVCGRRRERFPERSIYNRLCDSEWDTPIGSAEACGGDVMLRAAAFMQAEGFRPSLIAGEEPELCLRLRKLGWTVWRLDSEMTRHDASMTRFRQWWRRTARAGFAFAEGASLHGHEPERYWVREARSARLWAMAVPLAIVAAVVLFGPVAAWLLLVYPLQVLRLALRARGAGTFRAQQALFLVLGKFAEASGQWRYYAGRLRGRRATLMEYK